MALVLADRVQETSTTSGTGTLTLNGAVNGFQSFANGVGNGNTCYYTIYDTVAYTWEVGVGTYTTSGSTLTRTTVLSNSSHTTSLINFAGNLMNVWVDYPAEKAVIQDTNGNISYNNSSPGYTAVTTTGGTTTLTAASTYVQNFKGTLTQTVKLPDETTIPAGTAFIIDNDSTGNVTVQDSGGNTLAVGVTGAAGYFYSTSNSAATGGWAGYAFMPNNVQWGSNGLPVAYGGTGATTISGAQTNLQVDPAGTAVAMSIALG